MKCFIVITVNFITILNMDSNVDIFSEYLNDWAIFQIKEIFFLISGMGGALRRFFFVWKIFKRWPDRNRGKEEGF